MIKCEQKTSRKKKKKRKEKEKKRRKKKTFGFFLFFVLFLFSYSVWSCLFFQRYCLLCGSKKPFPQCSIQKAQHHTKTISFFQPLYIYMYCIRIARTKNIQAKQNAASHKYSREKKTNESVWRGVEWMRKLFTDDASCVIAGIKTWLFCFFVFVLSCCCWVLPLWTNRERNDMNTLFFLKNKKQKHTRRLFPRTCLQIFSLQSGLTIMHFLLYTYSNIKLHNICMWYIYISLHMLHILIQKFVFLNSERHSMSTSPRPCGV